ncbi:MAG: molecular chaperone HtpG, partial [Lachnospiraceae bacterium]|nr:molecular chaperone HtpG [Lachnospiraceae bacterium]
EVKPTDTEDEEENKDGAAENTEEKKSGDDSEDSGKNADEPEKVEGEIVDENGKPVEEEEKKEKKIYYVTDPVQQSQYVNMFKAAKMTAVVMTHNIDQPFIQQLEGKNEGVRFLRIDAEVEDTMRSKTSKKEIEEFKTKSEELEKKLRKTLKKSKLSVKLDKLKNKKVASMITFSEESRRMQDMMKMYSMGGDMGDMFKDSEGETLILNAGHPLVQKIMEDPESDTGKLIEQHLYDLALLSNKQLSPDEMTKFIQRSNDILMKL